MKINPDILCLGEAMVEVTLSPSNPAQAQIGFAGDTLNTAIYLKRCEPQLTVGFATKLGTDGFSDQMIALMQAEGLETGAIAQDATRMPGLYAIQTDKDGERSFSYWRDTSAARAMFTPPGLSFETLDKAKHLYFSAISLAILPEKDRLALLDWLPDYRSSGGTVVFDSNYRPRLWPDAETARRDIERAWRVTNIGLPSVDDEMALFADANAEQVLDRLNGWGLTIGALKCGAQGPVRLDRTPSGPYPSADRVIDTTAAGDSFNAGYLAARLSGASEDKALAQGHALAACVVAHRGAIIDRSSMP